MGIVFFIFIVHYAGAVESTQKAALLAENPMSMFVMMLFVYVIFGIALVVLSLALHDRLKSGAPAVDKTT